jgi:hypothetical protein
MQSVLLSLAFSVALALGLSPRVSRPVRHSTRSRSVLIAQDEAPVAVPGSADVPATNAGDDDDDDDGAGASQTPGDTQSAQQPSASDSDDNPSAQQPSSSSDDDGADNPSVQQPVGDNGGAVSGEANAPSDDDDQ